MEAHKGIGAEFLCQLLRPAHVDKRAVEARVGRPAQQPAHRIQRAKVDGRAGDVAHETGHYFRGYTGNRWNGNECLQVPFQNARTPSSFTMPISSDSALSMRIHMRVSAITETQQKDKSVIDITEYQCNRNCTV